MIYVGTFSKVMFPALRLSYVVVPDASVDAISRARTTINRLGFSSGRITIRSTAPSRRSWRSGFVAAEDERDFRTCDPDILERAFVE